MAPPPRRAGAFVGALLAALALAAPASGQGLACADNPEVRGAVLCLVNAERTARGLGPLSPNLRLGVAAQRHADDMVARGFFSHVTPGGSDLADRAAGAGYLRGATSWELGEDIAAAQPGVSPQEVVGAWMASPRHREVILTSAFRQAGIGVTNALPHPGAGAGTTIVIDLGTRRLAGASTARARQARASR